ncbi:MAG: isocitrate/isopropylmalate dehydrogenase family protein [Actinobacteria bacterium]|nr:isocitrate/isopropylmalate dehydrogenase family protein [Actinomycetota bacterium]
MEIAVLKGDDIGPDIVAATVRVLDAALRRHRLAVDWVELPVGAAAVASHGSTLPASTVERLATIPGWILGPIGHHAYPADDPRYLNPSGKLRKQFELYANVRPSRALAGVKSVRPDLDLVIVRENTEGFYADRNVLDGNGELRPDEDTVISVRVVTRRASLRVARQAFELAAERNRLRRVTVVHKANVLRRGDGLFLDACRAVARDHPDIHLDDFLVDAFAMRLILRPGEHDVVVTTNMFGDILSDEAAALTGGLGLAPGLNVGDEHAMAQAVHGSAPDIAGRGIANPIAEILSGALLLGWLARRLDEDGFSTARATVEDAVAAVLRRGESLTPDLGGQATTEQLIDAIVAEMPVPSPSVGGTL